MNVEALKTPEKPQHARGRDAAQGDVELDALCTWPSREYLEGYFAARYGDHALGTILAAVVLNVDLWKIPEAIDAVRQLPPEVLRALARALDDAHYVADHSGPRAALEVSDDDLM